jgi:large subunit ribosomal protein L19
MALSIRFHQTSVSVGDTVRVSQKIKEGEKERLQHFEGVVIAIKGNFGERTVTVRRIAAGRVGVEKVFPVDLPNIEKVVVTKRANVRRAKLYYLRQRKGKLALKLKEQGETGRIRRAGRPKASRKKRV